ncbi:MAG: hypothetical protein ABFD10_06605 [Prolixibacteraceae bacterium]
MKKLSILLVIVAGLTNPVFSQDVIKIRELGIFTSDFNDFGVRFKTGTDDLMYRFSIASLNLSNAEYDFGSGNIKDEDEFGISLAGGVEIPVSMNDRFDLFYGGEISFQHSNSDIVNENSIAQLKFTGIGAGVVLGFSYYLSPKVKLSAEVVPGLNFVTVKEDDKEVSGWKFQMDSQTAGMTLSFRF